MPIVSTRDELERALAVARDMTRIEIVTALRAPQRAIINLLINRADDLEMSADLDEFVEQVSRPNWGDW